MAAIIVLRTTAGEKHLVLYQERRQDAWRAIGYIIKCNLILVMIRSEAGKFFVFGICLGYCNALRVTLHL